MDEFVSLATRHWTEWFESSPCRPLVRVVLAGGPAHRDRALLALFGAGDARPSVVVKVGLSAAEASFVEREFDALTKANEAVAPAFSTTFPRPLMLHRSGGYTASFTTAIAGRRLVTPAFRGPSAMATPAVVRAFVRRATAWSDELAAQTVTTSRDAADIAALVDTFRARFGPQLSHERELDAFGRRVSIERIVWNDGWQHGDLTMPNVLVAHGRLRVLDWEHAGPDRQPWLDAGTLPGMLAFLAKRQGVGSTLVETAKVVLSTKGRIGAVIESELRRAWHHPIPIGWAVTLAAMHKALLAARNIERPAWADLAIALVQDRSLRSQLGWMAP